MRSRCRRPGELRLRQRSRRRSPPLLRGASTHAGRSALGTPQRFRYLGVANSLNFEAQLVGRCLALSRAFSSACSLAAAALGGRRLKMTMMVMVTIVCAGLLVPPALLLFRVG